MSSVKILGTGHYVPPYTVINEDFAKFVETSDEWITTRTGMKTRHIATVDDPTWYMGALAAKKAMKEAGAAPESIGLVIATTVTSDFYTPSLASIVQRELGIENSFAFDVNVACTGLSFAMDAARRYLCTGDVDRVLIVCAESLSQFIDYTDRSMCVLFGDGAGACVVERAEGVYGTYQHCDISGTEHIYGKRRRRSTPFSDGEAQANRDPFPIDTVDFIKMNGREIYKFTTKAMPDAIGKACAKAGIAVSDLKVILPHQANLRILQTAAKNMDISMDQIGVNIQDYGNTSSATIAICLDECIRSGRIARGDYICLVGFGAGLCFGATVFQY